MTDTVGDQSEMLGYRYGGDREKSVGKEVDYKAEHRKAYVVDYIHLFERTTGYKYPLLTEFKPKKEIEEEIKYDYSEDIIWSIIALGVGIWQVIQIINYL